MIAFGTGSCGWRMPWATSRQPDPSPVDMSARASLRTSLRRDRRTQDRRTVDERNDDCHGSGDPRILSPGLQPRDHGVVRRTRRAAEDGVEAVDDIVDASLSPASDQRRSDPPESGAGPAGSSARNGADPRSLRNRSLNSRRSGADRVPSNGSSLARWSTTAASTLGGLRVGSSFRGWSPVK
jgi:hypothetical protein